MTESDRRARAVLEKIPSITETDRGLRRPIFVEFSGTPKSGKTTTLDGLERFLRHNGFKVGRLAERASTCPVRDKDYIMFNIWTACTTLAQIAEEVDRSDLHFVLIDRGLFDALWWFEWMHVTGKLAPPDKHRIWDFFSLEPWAKLIDLVFVMKTSPDTAMKRERQFLPTDTKGKIMDPVVLAQLNECIARVTSECGGRFRRIVEIETDSGEAKRDEQNLGVINETLGALEGFLDEQLLVFPSSELAAIGIAPGLTSDPAVIDRLVKCVAEKARPIRKSIAERDGESVMVVPCGIIRHGNQVLLLRRREIDTRHRLNNKYVIWAGGHIRDDDRSGTGTVTENCLARELNEELRLRTKFTHRPIACVLDAENERSSRHIGLVYDVEVESTDVAIHMQRGEREFREGRGKGVSGRFFDVHDIEQRYIDEMEAWSYMLLRDHFGRPLRAKAEQSSLFS